MNTAQWEFDHAQRFGDHVGLIEGERAWTNGELHERACRLARALSELGVEPGDRVAVALENGVDLFTAASAAGIAGAVLVVMADVPEQEARQMLEHCEPAVLIIGPHRAGARAVTTAVRTRILAGGACGASAGDFSFEELIAEHAPRRAPVAREAGDAAQLCYTSGATGAPKAVIYTHGGMDAFWRARVSACADPEASNVVLLAIPPTAFGSRFIGMRVIANNRYVLLPKFVPAAVLEAVERHRVNEIPLVPTLAEQLAAARGARHYDCSSLRAINISGAHVSASLIEKLRERLAETRGAAARAGRRRGGAPNGSKPDDLRIVVHYGMTETGGGFASTGTGGDGVVGQVMPGVQVTIVDEAGRDVASGSVGEILVRTPFAAAGYWRDAARTAEVFRGGYVHTGDLGRFNPAGELCVVGRSKDVIIQGGFNVLPNEVAGTIQSLAEVAECAVLGVRNELLGEEVVACVVPRAGVSVTEAQIRAHCRARLDPRKVPARVLLLDRLDKTHSGKIDVSALRRIVASVSGAGADATYRRIDIADAHQRLPLVREVVEAALRSALLESMPAGRQRKQRDGDATFGEMGLESIGAVRVAHQLSAEFGRTFGPTLVYSNPSVQSLSEHIHSALWGAPSSSVQQVRRGGQAEFRGEEIAIVGIGCRLPGGVSGPREFWELLERGRDTVGEEPAERRSGSVDDWRASFLTHAEHFDGGFFGLDAEAAQLDPRHRMVLEVAWEALEDAGCNPLAVRGDGTGVFLGIYGERYRGPDPLARAPGMAVAYLCQFLDIRGPVQSIDTTCSSSLVAVHCAVSSLRQGECDLAIVGGANLLCPSDARNWLGVIAADGRSKAFDGSANGFGQGEGCVLLVLKRLADARAARDRVYATLLGTAIGHDGCSSSLTAPNPQSQAEVIRRALASARVAADRVHYVEAHGTGTLLGDPVEVDGLCRVFGERKGPPLTIGSVKTNIGHLEAASGVAGLAKVALAIHARRLPASLNFSTPNPHIPWDSIPVRVQGAAGTWPNADAALIAGVSSFGLSGTNAHVIVSDGAPGSPERHGAPAVDAAAEGPWLLVLSAKTESALRASAAEWATTLERPDDRASCLDVAHTASCRRAHLRHRLALVGRGRAQWAADLRDYAAGGTSVLCGASSESSPRLAMVFGGEGARWPGIDRELLIREPRFRDALERCASLVDARVAWRLMDELMRDARASRMDQPEVAQPAWLALHVGLYELWRAWGVSPAAAAGCGIGEVSAAYACGLLTLEGAVELACARGRVLQKARRRGSSVRVAPSELGAELADAVAGLKSCPSRIPLISTLSGARTTQMRTAHWGEQLVSPVRLQDAAKALTAEGCSIFVGIGPHPEYLETLSSTLGGDRADRSATVVETVAQSTVGLEAFLGALGRVYCAGYPIDFATRLAGWGRPVDLPTYRWDHLPYWHRAEDESPTSRVAHGHSPPVPLQTVRSFLRERCAGLARVERVSVGSDTTLDELGIDSLAAMKLREELRAKFGIAVHPSVFRTDLTLGNIAESAARPVASPSPRGADASAALTWMRSEGNGPLNVWIHPVGGGTSCYRALARGLPFRSSAIASPALHGGKLPASTIEEMATLYLATLEKEGILGQAILGGWSLGGVIALEMAIQLRRLGREVPLVILIDSYLAALPAGTGSRGGRRDDPAPMSSTNIPGGWQGFSLDAELIRGFFVELASVGVVSSADLPRISEIVQSSVSRESELLLRKIARDIASAGAAREIAPDDLERLLETLRLNLDALRQYRPTLYEGSVLSIRAVPAPGDPDGTLRAFAPKLEVQMIDASHHSILRDPELATLIKLLGSRIQPSPRGPVPSSLH